MWPELDTHSRPRNDLRALRTVVWALPRPDVVEDRVGNVIRTISCPWAWSQGHLEETKVTAATSRERQ